MFKKIVFTALLALAAVASVSAQNPPECGPDTCIVRR